MCDKQNVLYLAEQPRVLPAVCTVANNMKEGYPVCVITALPVFCQESKGYRWYVVKMMNCLCVSM